MGHPQDLVTLFHCCRAGELQVLKQLIAKGVSVNVRDRWDSTPLYYACLCGHKAVVQLLLESGASCNADTYDGERCLHGALTIEIRNLLKKFQICAKNVRSRTTYHQFMSKLRKDRMYADCCVVTNDGEKVAYHGCIAEKVIPISPAYESWNLNSEHLNAILDFLYTAVVDTQPFDELSALKGTAERYGVQELQHLLHVEDRKREELNIKKLYYPYHKTLFAATLEGDFEECKKRMEELFEVVCREPRFCDIVLTVNEEQTFYCHKCVVCLRSPYIQSFVEFADNTEETNVQQLHLNSINIDVFREALRYIYTDNIQLTDSIDAHDMLEVADMFLVPGMKNKVAKLLCSEICLENVIELIRMSRHFCVVELEHQAVQFISSNLEQIIFSEDFKKLVMDDANTIIGRQDIDSIDVIDAIRFHLHAAEDFALVDELLSELNLLA